MGYAHGDWLVAHIPGAIAEVSNQFAAMPSLHFGWSMWCCLALYPVLRNRLGKVLIAYLSPKKR